LRLGCRKRTATTVSVRLAAILLSPVLLLAQPDTIRTGPLPGGGSLLPTGWIVRPAGRQIELSTLPTNSVLSPDGKYLVVLHTGYLPPSLYVLDTETWRTVDTHSLPDAGPGLALTVNGRLLYVSGGSSASISEIALSPEGKLSRNRFFEIVPARDRTHQDYFGDISLTPDNRLLFVADLFRDRILVVNPQSGRVIDRFACRRRPYRIVFHPDGKSYFVTSWADGVLQQFQTEDGYNMGTLRLGPQATDMIWRDKKTALEEGQEFPFKARIFVTASNTNRVYSVGITESKDMKLLDSINLAMTPRQPLGMTPSALALSPDQNQLFVVCSDFNAVAVAEVSGPQAVGLGYVPTGWYPTSARVLPDGRLVVLNGKGSRSWPARRGPDPFREPVALHSGSTSADYAAARQKGSASIIEPFADARLEMLTTTVLENTPYSDRRLEKLDLPPGHPLLSAPGTPSLIQHVIYIVKHGRTYDQVLGDIPKGRGDSSLTQFPEQVTPNHHKLAQEFVLFDNFYSNGDTGADGHSWSIAASAPAYAQRMWPAVFAGGRRNHYDFDGLEPAALPPAGYLWTQVLAAGLSMRSYGFFTDHVPLKEVSAGANHVASVRESALAAFTNMRYRGLDLDYPDLERARVFLSDLARFESGNDMPRFLMLRLAGDHTSGMVKSRIAPRAAMADHDYALGLIVEACARSKFWPKMAIFVVEESADNGSDHVDAHRTPAFILSPYTRRGGIVDSTFYNTTSMLRTMELILGLRPMTVFDAASPPMSTSFSLTPDLSPYHSEKPRVPVEERNP
jgi:DNA-binding beta-propeller fold protein YncE